MKSEDLLNLILDKTTEVKAIMDDFQHLTEHLAEVAKIGTGIVEKIEKIKK